MWRRAGILLALSSLPGVERDGLPGSVTKGGSTVPGSLPDSGAKGGGPLPAGALGKAAYDFVDFLSEAGQRLWQILPIGPVGDGLSPYQSRSAFAGNPAFIDRRDIRQYPGRYAPKGAAYTRFLNENAAWLDDYALFEAVRASQRGKPLPMWPDGLRNPSAKMLSSLREKFETETGAVKHEQFCFFLQWRELKRYANLKGVGIIGDLPIYVYEDSAEFWLRRRAFDAGADGRPRTSAGVPPDGFSKDGQIWNNPVYDWGRGRKEAFAFWRERLAQAVRLYDGVRIDHFRAFADFYAYPMEDKGGGLSVILPESRDGGALDLDAARNQVAAPICEGQGHANLRNNVGLLTARDGSPPKDEAKEADFSVLKEAREGEWREGEWREGPGKAFTDMLRKEYPGFFIIAEDLGELSDAAKNLVAESGFPGMKVLQFAFSGDPGNPYLPHNIPEHSVCFTGTHDNNTLLGWARGAPRAERLFAMEYLGLSRRGGAMGAQPAKVSSGAMLAEALADALLAQALASRAETAIIPLQDWLGLGAEARMNKPGTKGGRNWKWQCPKGALTRPLAARIRHATKDLYDR